MSVPRPQILISNVVVVVCKLLSILEYQKVRIKDSHAGPFGSSV